MRVCGLASTSHSHTCGGSWFRFVSLFLLTARSRFSSRSRSSSIFVHGETNNVNVVVGDDPSQFPLNWVDGACYLPIRHVRVGDTIEFRFSSGRHNVVRLKDEDAYDNCDFDDDDDDDDDDNAVAGGSATKLLSTTSPFVYTVSEEDASRRSLYFACAVGSHCMANQKVRVDIDDDDDDDAVDAWSEPTDLRRGSKTEPVSKFLLNVNDEVCAQAQERQELVGLFENEDETKPTTHEVQSTCDDIIESQTTDADADIDIDGDDNGQQPITTYFRSCLSQPFTLTPGGVVNRASVVYYPFPTDHRVVLGARTWEFVHSLDDSDSPAKLIPTPINQLYVHHILGSVVRGNGAEGMNHVDHDAPFPYPYGLLTGDFSNVMTFHLIDLRETGDQWLECLECRCSKTNNSNDNSNNSNSNSNNNNNNTDNSFAFLNYNDDRTRGGVRCCTNCTMLTTPTIDYRMRYNVSWTEITPNQEYVPIFQMRTDMALALNRYVEWDVPYYQDLPLDQRHPTRPKVQVLTRTGPLRQVFGGTAIDDPIDAGIGGRGNQNNNNDNSNYRTEKTLEIHRCIGHMHIGGMEAYIHILNDDDDDDENNNNNNKLLCHMEATYGTDPLQNEGFLTHISVENLSPPIVLDGDTNVRVTVHYNATELHTGVMGLFALMASDYDRAHLIRTDETSLTVDLCETPKCDASYFPNLDDDDDDDDTANDNDNTSPPSCDDRLPQSILCERANVCSCDTFLDLPQIANTGGCDGGYLLLSAQNRTIPVERLCAKTCGCGDGNKSSDKDAENNGNNPQTALEQKVKRQFDRMYQQTCTYATAQCRDMLSNLYTCAKHYSSQQQQQQQQQLLLLPSVHNDIDHTIHPTVRNAIKELQDPRDEQGVLRVFAKTKLGNPQMQRYIDIDTDEDQVGLCHNTHTNGANGDAKDATPPNMMEDESLTSSGNHRHKDAVLVMMMFPLVMISL